MGIIIKPELRDLLPAPSADDLSRLEKQIREEGCRDPLVVWKSTGILLDGHKRYSICDRLGLGFKTVAIEVADIGAAKLWMFRNQENRRNWSDYQRAAIALQLKNELAAEAEARMKAGRSAASKPDTHVGRKSDPWANSPKGGKDCNSGVSKRAGSIPSSTRATLARAADVSEHTIRDVEKVETKAAEPVKEMARAGEVSISAAATVATLPKAEQMKVASEGPAAVKAKAKEIRGAAKAEPDPDESEYAAEDEVVVSDPSAPWADFEREVLGVVSDLRSARIRLGKVMKFKAGKPRWANFYVAAGTTGAVNAVIRNLLDNLPAERSDKPPGFVPRRSVQARKAFAANRR